MDEGSKEPSIPNSWLKRSREQQKKLDDLTPKQRKAWGFTESSVRTQQQKDEENNPSE